MAIFNFGSINVDHFYTLPNLPKPGETLAATDYSAGLGGKGANQSIAAQKGGAKVHHIGAVGQDGVWALSMLRASGVDVENVQILDMATGHAIISIEESGENSIVIFSSANVAQRESNVIAGLKSGTPKDYCLLQNETNLVQFAAETAHANGMRVVYSAAPFDAEKVQGVLPFVDILALNEVEAAQLADALGVTADHLPVAGVLITKGADGAVYRDSHHKIEVPAFSVDPVDTTGAGDTYLGFFVAGLDAGMDFKGAMTFAAAGAALQVTRPGTAEAIPNLTEVKAFLETELVG